MRVKSDISFDMILVNGWTGADYSSIAKVKFVGFIYSPKTSSEKQTRKMCSSSQCFYRLQQCCENRSLHNFRLRSSSIARGRSSEQFHFRISGIIAIFIASAINLSVYVGWKSLYDAATSTFLCMRGALLAFRVVCISLSFPRSERSSSQGRKKAVAVAY